MGAPGTGDGHRAALIAAVARERERLVSRRLVLRRAVGGSAALFALALAPTASRLSAQDAPSPAFTDDVDVLSYALTLEHLAAAFYADGLTRIVADEVPGDDPDAVIALLAEIARHEEAHAVALTEVIAGLGGQPPAPQSYAFQYGDTEEFFKVALALANTATAAYAGAIPSASDPVAVTALLSIHSVEARHAAYLGGLLRHHSPFPTAFDQALTRSEVEEITDVLITEGTPPPEPSAAPTDAPSPPPPAATAAPSEPGQATPIPLR